MYTRNIKKWPALILTLLLFTSLQAQIVNIEERRITGTNDSTNWYGFTRVGATLSEVKDQVILLNATGQIQYKKSKDLILLLLDAKFLRAGEQDFSRSGFAHLRYNHDLSERLVTETFVQAQYNKLLLIRLRTLGGGGLRYRFHKSENGRNRIYGGLAYLYEYTRYLEEFENMGWHRMSSYVSFTFRPSDKIKLVNTTYYQPQIDRFRNYRMSTEWRLDLPIGQRISFNTDFTYSIDKSLPADAPVSTYIWTNGLTFRF